MRVAVIELVPWAMLANGPPWTNAGTPSVVCARFGLHGVAQQRGHRADGLHVAAR